MASLKVETQVTRRITVKLHKQDVLTYLIDEGIMPSGAMHGDPSVYVQVPSGGDWSGERLELDGDNPVCVTWTETTTTKDPSE